MKETFLNIKNTFARRFGGGTAVQQEATQVEEEDYLELAQEDGAVGKKRVQVRQFVMDDFEDIKPVISSLRQGLTIALINIQPLKEKDIVELKRAVNKLKKTCDAIDGDIAGFGDDYIVATPEFASVYRNKEEVMDTIDDDDDFE